MTTAGKTARGLRPVPKYTPPADPSRQGPQPEEKNDRRQPRKRAIKHKLFSLGYGLDMPMLIFILVLLAIGLVMLFSASYAYAYFNEDGNSYYYISRQATFAVSGVIAMLAISLFDYHHFHKLALPLFVVSVVFLLIVLIFRGGSIAPEEGEAARWLVLGPINFQPSEIAKFSLIVMFAHLISQRIQDMGTFRHGVVPFIAIMGLFGALIMMENHLSATLIILILGAVMMFIGGTKARYFIFGGSAMVLGIGAYVLSKGGYQMERITGWLDPFHSTANTWQTVQSLYAIGSGGFLGVGLGQSRQKYLYLPEPQNDFIFAIVCEELGFVGALIIIILFSLLIWRGIYISIHAKDKFGMMLGLGITFQIGLQTVLNICVVTNTIPNTGISLPFFSYGGTALLMLLGEMGILLNISRTSNVEKV